MADSAIVTQVATLESEIAELRAKIASIVQYRSQLQELDQSVSAKAEILFRIAALSAELGFSDQLLAQKNALSVIANLHYNPGRERG